MKHITLLAVFFLLTACAAPTANAPIEATAAATQTITREAPTVTPEVTVGPDGVEAIDGVPVTKTAPPEETAPAPTPETLGAIRVQLKTDSRNVRSQKAIERIGGVKEGVLRNHMLLLDGTIRHSVFYSILDSEWEGVKKKLEEYLVK